ncbi:MAG: hypothetical protein ACOZIN_19400 [Myxococcota bacterium]
MNALAQRERVPARIAKGELEGKMKCRVWKKLHPEESKRFDQVYELMSKHPSLPLPEAFGVLQSGLSVEDFLARRARSLKKVEVKEARGAVSAEATDAWIAAHQKEKTELAFVLAERTLVDVLTAIEPVSFTLEKGGRLEKLQVVLIARRAEWEKRASALPRDPKLTQKPSPVSRQPERRPVSDPRPFLELLGKPLQVVLRNGVTLEATLRNVGPFDLLLEAEGEQLFVPLHAIVRWTAKDAAPPP